MRLWRYLLYLIYSLLGKEAVRLNLRLRRRVLLPVRVTWVGGGGYTGMVTEGNYEFLAPHDLPLAIGKDMAKIGDKFVASIAPTNAAGKPAPVSDVLFEELTNLYDEVSLASDGLSVTFEAALPGSGAVVNVSAKSKSGVLLSDSKPLPDVDAPAVDEEAVALNLTIAPV